MMRISNKELCFKASRTTFRALSFMKRSMLTFKKDLTIIRGSEAACLIMLSLVIWSPLEAQSPTPSEVTFEVVSVRVLSDKEAGERSPDFIGPNVAVRLRLSTMKRGLRFHCWKNSPIPAKYKVERTQNGIVWLYGNAGTESKPRSPGIQEALYGSKGDWAVLPSHAAIEWEELDSTFFSGKKHAFTIFIRETDKDEPKEVISDWYTVPAVAAKPE